MQAARGAFEEQPKSNPCMARFLRMQKAGIPLVTIQNSVRLQGHDMKELDVAFGVKGDSSTDAGAETEIEVQKAPKINPCMAKFLNMQKAGIPLGATQQAVQVQGVD